MNRTCLSLTLGMACAALFAFPAAADQAAERDKLIALDKAWGATVETADLEQILDPRLMAISPDGIADRAQLIADDTGPMPPGENYTAENFKVTFLNDNIAVMVHSTAGSDAHYSLHVWEKEGGNWRVVATATSPASP